MSNPSTNIKDRELYRTVSNMEEAAEKKEGGEEKETLKVETLTPEQQLFHFARQGDSQGITSLRNKVNYDAQDEGRDGKYASLYTALHYACQNGHLAVVEVLYSLGVKLNAENKFKSTPLHIAAANGQAAIVKYLIGKGASLREENKIGNIPLHCAIYAGHVEAVKILLDEDQDPKAALRHQNGLGIAPVRYCPRDHMEMRKYLYHFFPKASKLSEEEAKLAQDLAGDDDEPPDYDAPVADDKKAPDDDDEAQEEDPLIEEER